MGRTVEVLGIDKSQKGRVVVTIPGKEGKPWPLGNLISKLDDSTISVLKGAKAGDKLNIEYKKEGNFWNLVSASAAKAVYTGGYTKDKDNGAGAQRGNAVTNAVTVVTTLGKFKDYNTTLKD